MLGQGAFYFNPNNEQEISDAMKHILKPGVVDALLEKAARERARSLFIPEKTIEKLDEVFAEAAKIRKCWP